MSLIDSHAHIYTKEFAADRADVIERAVEAGVEKIYMPNIDHESIDSMLEVAERFSSCIPMMGLHPCSVDRHFEKHLYEVEEYLAKGSFCAVGEIGTDLYWDKSHWEEQVEAFNIQCEMALSHGLAVVIHCRESIDETIQLVEPFVEKGLKGVFHCFTGTLEQAKRIIASGFFLGIGGVATFKNGGLVPVLEEISLQHILLETDSPYLAPVPFRGKRNEPSYVKKIAEKIAEIGGHSFDEIGEITTQNSLTLFTK